MEELSNNKCFDGEQLRFSHKSSTVNCEMQFSVFLPPQAKESSVPVLFWLSGLTCTDENFVFKAGAQKYASKYGIAIIAPDTSPRGKGIPDDVEGAYDFGLGAGFYLNATEYPWNLNYQMHDYINNELTKLIEKEFPVNLDRCGIFGHSMGGHGALCIGLKNPKRFKAISAFAPICSPINCSWGKKAFKNYLGDDEDNWKNYDACELVLENKAVQQPVLVDQGSDDEFLSTQLKPELLEKAFNKAERSLQLRMQNGYDHSYFFIASFIQDHLRFHRDNL
ncbi:MAG: S-formylglutathione hydrolase [Pseudomonadota bacterium]|nr:S-formylglutathione hydrolase [Pseudomonadota bacterium]